MTKGTDRLAVEGIAAIGLIVAIGLKGASKGLLLETELRLSIELELGE